MADNNDLIELGGLWLNESKSGTKYFSGYLGQAKILIFKNEHKKEDSHPDYRMYAAPGKRQSERNDKSGTQQGDGRNTSNDPF